MYPNGALPDMFAVLFVDVASGKRLTFDQLRTTGEQFAKGLQDQWQWHKGDVLATVTPNAIDLVPATFGALLVGGVICPLNFMYTVNELVAQLSSSKAKGLITNVACIQAAREAASIVGLPLDRILLVGEEDPNQHRSQRGSGLPGVLFRNHRPTKGSHVDTRERRGQLGSDDCSRWSGCNTLDNRPKPGFPTYVSHLWYDRRSLA
jgi:hypothetical protein